MTKWRDEESRASAAAGFITALWASGGLAILAAGLPGQELRESWLVALMFVVVLYMASYFIGGWWLGDRRVRRSLWMSWVVAFATSELVLGAASVAGGVGATVLELSRNGWVPGAWAYPLQAPLLMCVYGAMFTLPLSLGLGLHNRLWSAWSES